MKSLVEYINESSVNESIDRMLIDLKELIPKSDWDKCDSMRIDDALQLIVDTLENYEEKTSVRLIELDKFNKMRKYGTVLVASYDNQASDVADELASYVDEDCLFAEDSCCIFNGQNVDVYFEAFKGIMIGGMNEWQNDSEEHWTFFIASDEI